VPNPMPLRWVHLPGEHARFDEQARLAAILAEHRELEFPPGARYGYSNLSYWLLGRLVEQVTGARFSDHLAGAIFRPLDLSPEEMAFTIPAGQRHAQGYLPRLSLMNLFKRFLVDEAFIGERQGPWVHVNDAYVDGPAYGGLVTSARALARLLQDLLADDSRLLGPRGRRLLLERQRDPDGEPVEMTLGWHVGERDGAPYYFKEGGGAGFHGERDAALPGGRHRLGGHRQQRRLRREGPPRRPGRGVPAAGRAVTILRAAASRRSRCGASPSPRRRRSAARSPGGAPPAGRPRGRSGAAPAARSRRR